MNYDHLLHQSRIDAVTQSLREDVGSGDITAQLIPADRISSGHVITREKAVIAGTDWVEEVFRQVDPGIRLNWHTSDGETVVPGQTCLQSMVTPAAC